MKANAAEYFIKLSHQSEIEIVAVGIDKVKSPLKHVDGKTYRKAFKVLAEEGLDRIYVVAFSVGLSETQFKSISELPGIEYIELVPVHQMFYTPNDLNSSAQWHLNRINAAGAWDLERGGKGIVLGLVDDGLDTSHSDIQPVLWHNSGEIKGNGTDDDNNGYIDDFFGWDAADNDNDPHVSAVSGLSHGTHCGGIAAALSDNNNGIASVGFNVRIMPVKIGRVGRQGLYNAYDAVEYAIVNKANVISMSWGGGPYSRTFQTLFNVAYNRNIVCVAAAGNSNDTFANYPAAYNHVIAVGSSDNADRKSGFSCYGSWIDVMAPGSSIYSTLPGNTYGYKSGTSMACPLVSGLCALMLSRNPGLTAAQVESCLKSTCDNINAQNSSFTGKIGAGRINAYRALMCVKPLNAGFISSKTFVCTGDTVRFYDQSFPASNSRVWNFQGGSPAISSALNPVVRYNTPGVYKVQLIATRGSVSDTLEKTAFITVGRPAVRFSGQQTINRGDIGTIKADFTGNPPWDLVYRRGNKYDTIRNIINTPYFILKVPDSTSVYKPVSVGSGTCAGSVFDSTLIIVNQNVTGVCDSSLRYHITFGGSGDDVGYDIAVGKDSNYYVSGYTRSRGAGSEDAFAARINNSGKIVWFKTFGNVYSDQFSGMTLDAKENIYLMGNSFPSSSGSDKMMLVVKLDKNGNTKWYKQFSGNSIEYMKSCIVSKFNSNVIYFGGPMVSNSYGGEDFMLMKCDTNGNVIWQKHYGTVSYTDRPDEMVEDNFGNIYMCGVSNGENLIMKIDSTGSLIYSKIYYNPNGNNEGIHGATMIGNSLYTAAYGGNYNGSTWNDREMIVMKTGPAGNVIWSRKYATSSARLTSSLLRIRSAGNTIFVSWSLNITGSEGFVMCLDTNGNILRYLSVGDNNSQVINSVFPLSDGSVCYLGSESSGNNEVMIGKTNCRLKNVCKSSSESLSPTNYTMNTANYSVSYRNSVLNNYTGLTISSHTVNTNIICITKTSALKSKCAVKADFAYLYSCKGDSVIFYDNSTDSFGFISDRNWDFGDGSKASANTLQTKHLYKAIGNYNVKLIVTSVSGNTICSDTAVYGLNIENMMNIGGIPADTQICIGDSITLKGPVIFCGKEPYTYAWSPSRGVDDSTSGNPYFAPQITTVYKLKIKDADGRTAEKSMKITVDNSCCKSKARFSVSKQEACAGDTIRFNNESTYDPNSYYFKWTFTGASIGSYTGINPPPLIFSNQGVFSVRLELSDLCSNDTMLMMYRVRALPVADAGRDTVLCRLDTIRIGTEAFGMNRYIWNPAINLSNDKVSDPLVICDSSRIYKLIVTDEFACSSTDETEIRLVIKSFKINNDTSYCEGDSVKLTIPGTGSYLWSDAKITQSNVFRSPGIYWGQLSNECVYRDTFKIDELPLPVFNLGNDSGFCKGSSFLLGTTVPGTYLWNTGANSASIQVNQSGNYWLRVNAGKCSYSDSIKLDQYNLPVFTLGTDRKFCRDSITLQAVPDINNVSYNWNNGKVSKTVKAGPGGIYILKISDQNNCEFSDTLAVVQGLLPELNKIPDLYKCIGNVYTLSLPSVNNQAYIWSDQTQGNTKTFFNAGTYSVTARTECGDSTVSFELRDSACICNVWLPNAFSPNGDLLNPKFGVISQCNLVDFSMKLYTRWGELVFETNDYNAMWDGTYKGKTVPLGMYMYVLEFRKDFPGFKEYFSMNGTFMVID